MTFKKQVTNVDYGITTIENIFINDFMPMANGTFVKVYLTGYKHACDVSTNLNMTNSMLAKHLNVSLEDVHGAWAFWEQKGIVKKLPIGNENSSDYGIEFLSLRQLYIDNNFELRKTEQPKVIKSHGYTSSSTDLIEALKVPDVRTMFRDIENIVKRPLVPNESREVLDWIYNYKMDPNMITTAFDYSVHKRNVRSVKYVASIIRNWYDQGIISEEMLENYLQTQTDKYMNYKKIYKILGYGSKPVSAGDKEVIDGWLNKLNLEMEFLEKVLIESSKKTSNVNMNYMNSIIKGLYEDNVRDIKSYELYLTKKAESKPKQTQQTVRKTTNRFQNFEGELSKLNNNDIEQMMLRKSKNRKKSQE